MSFCVTREAYERAECFFSLVIARGINDRSAPNFHPRPDSGRENPA